ncbi:11794_t:CDS:1, partial [Ambispora leptoticha]
YTDLKDVSGVNDELNPTEVFNAKDFAFSRSVAIYVPARNGAYGETEIDSDALNKDN